MRDRCSGHVCRYRADIAFAATVSNLLRGVLRQSAERTHQIFSCDVGHVTATDLLAMLNLVGNHASRNDGTYLHSQRRAVKAARVSDDTVDRTLASCMHDRVLPIPSRDLTAHITIHVSTPSYATLINPSHCPGSAAYALNSISLMASWLMTSPPTRFVV
jgi:hypothetical protein